MGCSCTQVYPVVIGKPMGAPGGQEARHPWIPGQTLHPTNSKEKRFIAGCGRTVKTGALCKSWGNT